MNFFEQQEHARSQTRKLVFLFALAVIAIVIAVNGVTALLWLWMQGQSGAALADPGASFPNGFFLTNTLITVGLIGGGTLVELFRLREGGEAVAAMAGGRLVEQGSRDAYERRLLNVVEEMALASGIACPKVYVLDKEASINAFAAGYNPNEAVVAVTRGTIERLNRDELQGVVAHEFSHILNGDMRLNVRLIGVLFGIQMIAGFGQVLLHAALRSGGMRSRSSDRGPSLQVVLLALGVSLFVMGYIGIFFGRLIKAGVSRQREHLADASAVQFTRNRDGIGGALRKIGGLSRSMSPGSRIEHPNAEQLSHLFLGAPSTALLSGFLATHPPIAERLRRIYGKEVELLDAPPLTIETAVAEQLPDIPYLASGFAGAGSDAGVAPPTAPDIASPTASPWITDGAGMVEQIRLRPELDSAAHDPQAACALVLAMLLERATERTPLIRIINAEVPFWADLAQYLVGAVAALPPRTRLPLLDLAIPALRQLTVVESSQLLATVDQLIAADQRISLMEFVLQTVLTRRLGARAGRAVPVKFNALAELRKECVLLLGLVAHVAHPASGQEVVAARTAFLRAASICPELELSISDFPAAQDISFEQVKLALERTNQLAPLAKPGLIKVLLEAASDGDADAGVLPIGIADTLRAICAALEAPLPPAVAAAYAECGLQVCAPQHLS